jgi:hypothetical protein
MNPTSYLPFAFVRTVLVVLCCFTCNAGAADAEPGSAPVVYTTKSGDSIERLLLVGMPGSPLNPSILRQAVADLNPKIVTGKPGQKFKTGIVITMPDHGQLVRSNLAPFASSPEYSARSGNSAGDPSSRRNWIRYP